MTLFQIYREILEDEVKISKRLHRNTRNLLQNLLKKNPASRLGHPNLGGPHSIKTHKFFEDINWLDIYLKRVPAPLKPYISVATQTDLTHFDNLPKTTSEELGNLSEGKSISQCEN